MKTSGNTVVQYEESLNKIVEAVNEISEGVAQEIRDYYEEGHGQPVLEALVNQCHNSLSGHLIVLIDITSVRVYSWYVPKSGPYELFSVADAEIFAETE